MTSLADTQSTADERYARAKADNAVLQARVHMLDEQIREVIIPIIVIGLFIGLTSAREARTGLFSMGPSDSTSVPL